MQKRIGAPLSKDVILSLESGDYVLVSGTIYVARDAAHKKMCEALQNGEPLPFDIEGQIIYYAGPCPARPGNIAGPFGPTTSGRMDKFAPVLMERGLKGMIGKGDRDDSVIDSMIKNGAVYFAAVGGLGAYIATVIEEQQVIAYGELGAEALFRLKVKDFPAIVAIDSKGSNLYRTEPKKYENKFEGLYTDSLKESV
ncbi:MAG: Fe-S-containing hydro-lyase [Caulobacteraceae bacterium]